MKYSKEQVERSLKKLAVAMAKLNFPSGRTESEIQAAHWQSGLYYSHFFFRFGGASASCFICFGKVLLIGVAHGYK